MARCIRWYRPNRSLKIVDLGSSNVNGSYRSLFPEADSYLGMDLEEGPGVDVVLDQPYELPIEPASADLVLSGQMLEHSKHFWKTFSEIERILKPEGLAFIIAPSAGPIHRFPVDCYRFYPDAYEALAEWSGLRLVHCWHDQRGPWRDLVGVFQKGGTVRALSAPPVGNSFSPWLDAHKDADVETIEGSRNYLDVLADIHEIKRPDFYFEIGVRRGASLRLAKCRAVGIDPSPDVTDEMPDAELLTCTSDDYFFFCEGELPTKPDLAFIDGLHLAEFALRDFMNLEKAMAKDGLIVVDDVLPNHPVQASRSRQSRAWCGDVWRLAKILARWRPDLRLTLLDASPTGLLLVDRLDPANRVLWDRYNPIVRELLGSAANPPDEILDRKTAIAPDRDALAELLA